MKTKGWLGFFGVLASGLVAMVAVALVSRDLHVPLGSQFNPNPLRHLRHRRPDFVLMGNSMVGTRFDKRELKRGLAPQTAQRITVPGSRTSVWYLMMKNYVVPSGHRPQRVIQFFRDRELTKPRERATGVDARLLETVSVGPDPVVERKLTPPLHQPIERLRWVLEREAPVLALRRRTEPWLDAVATLVSEAFAHPEKGRRKRAINRLFATGKVRDSDTDAEEAVEDDDQRSFQEALPDSFLPEFMKVAAEAHVPLAFVRIRTERIAKGIPDPPALARYIADLRHYLSERDAVFVDMTSATWEETRLYGEYDHILPAYKRMYTRRFIREVPQVFR